MAGVQDLIQHLRSNPTDRDLAAISARFGVEERIVQIAIDSMPKAPRRQATGPSKWSIVWATVLKYWNKATDNTLLFLVASNVLYAGVFHLIERWPTLVGGVPSPAVKTWKTVLMAVWFLGIPGLQLTAIARKPQIRMVFYGALLFALTLGAALFFVATGPADSSVRVSGEPVKPGLLVAITCFSFGFLYVLVGVPVTVGSAYLKMRKDRKSKENLTRQQMLERLIQIRQTLADSGQEPHSALDKGASKLLWLERNALWISFALSIVSTAAYSMTMKLADPQGKFLEIREQNKIPQGFNTALLLIPILINFATMAAQFGLGLLAKRMRGAVGIGMTFIVGYVLIHLTPVSYMPLAMIVSLGWGPFLFSTWSQLVLVCLGCLARQVYEYSKAAARRQQNDPDALMAELLDLEWRLTPKSSQVSVLAIDVVGSTAMKKEADPIVTEWSFREYQKWVENTCAAFGGKVESTAGDGAIVGFVEPANAADAALALQAGIDSFNKTVNKMSQPFLLRIGLHTGEVQGELGDVQFTRVIDVAAHIESKAPVGGIAASEMIMRALGGRNFQKSESTTDGHDVYVLTTP